tara:strand:- start:529 stop:738 length:210 start_codon:yes stop_codon:yes gene_type:complete
MRTIKFGKTKKIIEHKVRVIYESGYTKESWVENVERFRVAMAKRSRTQEPARVIDLGETQEIEGCDMFF